MPTQPRTADQVAARTRLAAISGSWRALTEAQRDAWKSWSAAHPTVDKLGQSQTLTGHQSFVKINAMLETLNQAQLSDPPADVEFNPEIATGVGAVLATVGGALSLTLAHTIIASGEGIAIFASPPKSAGVSFNADYRLIVYIGAQAAGDYGFAAEYQAKFGAPLEGQKIFVRCFQIKDGNKGNPMDFTAIVTPEA
jgi:hypothetical protein